MEGISTGNNLTCKSAKHSPSHKQPLCCVKEHVSINRKRAIVPLHTLISLPEPKAVPLRTPSVSLRKVIVTLQPSDRPAHTNGTRRERATLGIRPEHLRIDAHNPTLMGEVLVVERLGGETYLYVKIAGGDTFIVQTDGDNRAKVRDRVPIHIDGTLCHLFNVEGMSIPKAERHHLTAQPQHPQVTPTQTAAFQKQTYEQQPQPNQIPHQAD